MPAYAEETADSVISVDEADEVEEQAENDGMVSYIDKDGVEKKVLATPFPD